MELLIKKPELKTLADRILSGLATLGDLERANIEDVRAIKCDTGEVHYRALAGEDVVLKEGSEERSKRYVASDENVDRMGDIIRQSGWDLKNHKRNPQVLWAHDARALPIGRVTDWEVGEVAGMPSLLETITYLEEGVSAEAEAVWKMVKAGVIRAVSVGFLPVKTSWPEDNEEREALGLGPHGVLFEKQEQLELSNCTIPANPTCLATRSVRTALRDMVTAGQISEAVARKLIDLGEKRTVQVSVPEGYEEIETTTSTSGGVGTVESFVVSGGKLMRVKSADEQPPSEPPVDEVKAEPAPPDPRVDMLLDEVRGMRIELSELPGKIEEAVTRGTREAAAAAKRTGRDLVNRVAARLAEEHR